MTIIDAPVRLDVTPLSGTIGAEIRGVDLKQPLDEATVAAIRGAWLEHKVVFFPDQHLSGPEHVAFGRHFGELTPAHPVIPSVDGIPELFEIDYTKVRTDPRYSDGYENRRSPWHTDVTFVERPALGSILNAVVIPDAGGDTVFADLQAAYEGLSEPLKELVDGLTAIHDGRQQFARAIDDRGHGEWEGEKFTQLVPVEHPVVRTHPETGKRNLFVNPGFTSHIKDVSRLESDAILNFLYEHQTKQEYLVRYQWQAGDLGFWDNRTTMHYAVIDYGDAHRVIQRVTLRGDRPI